MDKQVLFRLDEGLLNRLDRALSSSGYKTRNAWFKEVVEDYLAKNENVSGGQGKASVKS